MAQAAGRCPFTPMRLPASAVVCAQGEVSASVSFIREGVVALCAVDSAGVERALSLRGPRSLLGLEGARGQPSPHEVRTLSPVALCSTSAETFRTWLGPETAPAAAVLSLLIDELGSRQQDAAWKRGGTLSRVARFLLVGGLGSHGTRPLEKQVAARMLGMRAETFSRCLARLEQLGAITKRGDRVLNPETLQGIVQGAA